MAETDFLALVGQGAEVWNRWRTDHPDIQPDLRAAYLFGQGLGGFDLSGVNLERACLIGANLRGADLTEACLQGVYAASADFSGANLSKADLRAGNFGEANFSEADLSLTQASGANFASVCFTGCCLANWNIDPVTALTDLRASHVYLGLSKTQRQPKRDSFKPGELMALLRRSPVSSPGAITSWRDRVWLMGTRLKDIRLTDARLTGIGLSGVGVTSAIALMALTIIFSAMRLSRSPSPQRDSAVSTAAQISAQEIAAVALPCQEAEPSALPSASAGYQYENGAIYYGKLANGQPVDGRGTMVYPSNNRYDGEYRGGQRNGCGTFTFGAGSRYIGQFKADEFSGQGTWILENGERYIGEFKGNQCSGQGTFILSNGSSKSGVWEEGKLLNSALSCDQGSLSLPPS